MGEQNVLPFYPNFPPRMPQTPEEALPWIMEFQDSVRDLYRTLAERMEALIVTGTIAERPVADGSLRFYFATDESPPVMYFDDGTWHALNAT